MHCLIVDDHPVSSFGLRSLVKAHFPDWKISTAISIYEANECVNTATDPSINLVLLDLMLEGENGAAFLSKLRQNSTTRAISTIVISAIDEEDTIALCQKLGARGYVTKNSGINQILRAIQAVSAGDEYFYTGNAEKPRTSQSNLPVLTSRQHELLDLLLDGHSNKVIAGMLDLRYGTVKNYMFDLMRLMSVRSRLELVAKVRASGHQLHSDMRPEAVRYLKSETQTTGMLLDPNIQNLENSKLRLVKHENGIDISGGARGRNQT